MPSGILKWLALLAWVFVFLLVSILEAVAFVLSLPTLGLRFLNKPLRHWLDRLSR